jgi:hypothetical protein
VGIGLRDPRSQKRDLGHPSISPFDIAENTCILVAWKVVAHPMKTPRSSNHFPSNTTLPFVIPSAAFLEMFFLLHLERDFTPRNVTVGGENLPAKHVGAFCEPVAGCRQHIGGNLSRGADFFNRAVGF